MTDTIGDGGAAARGRLRTDLFGWQQDRPLVAADRVPQLRAQLESALAELGDDLDAAATATGRRQLLVTKTRLDRLACDGWALDPAPFEHTRANVRGTLAHKVFERELERREGDGPPTVVAVAAAWRELAAWKPGDPRSVSAWLNACPRDEADHLRTEVALLLDTFREVWPDLPSAAVELRTERRLDVTVAGGRVRLQGTLDLLVDSRRRDDRARALVVDFKTGMPRSDHDRAEVRFYALLTALATGRLPFRWATFYVTEGRPEVEDLHDATLDATVRRVVDAVRQAARLAAVRDGLAAPRLQGGVWCRGCLRQDDCDEADRARAAYAARFADG
ncbi:MAG: PD-(D/E)XK nuclease family protein [Nitriliruptor sp.]|uniref:PD-(D/E)XK nuclease family protein n=1 Tax=Nitriliruptor sp. TaxID=2448056 RepID=UPI00349FE6CA